MSARELVVLGTASQVPTRERNHNGYLLRWDASAFLFDPGEGTQRQMTHAGVSAASVTHICITHFHGDHCLGLPGVLQRMSLDGVSRPVELLFPASGAPYVDRLVDAAIHHGGVDLRRRPLDDGDTVAVGDLTLTGRALEHSAPTLGWRLEEPDGRTMLPDRLAEAGVSGPDVGRLQREGAVEVDGRTVRLEEVSVPRAGQRFAFVMDTAPCAAAEELARDVDLLVCEATFLSEHADLAAGYRHLTAADAARLADRAGARRLVLTHFSQRYPDLAGFAEEAGAIFDEVVVARDLDRIPLPERPPRPVDRADAH
ncbi:MAG: ribonuclease Z [Actinobacteria bacterium]|nr:ribonuclease Z [Actinomycetota bacterium]